MAGPPKFDLHDGEVVYTETLCKGSKLIRVRAKESSIDYEPGHVLALSIPKDGSEDPEGEGENKGKHGDGTKGPYTITRSDAAKGTFDVIYRIIQDGRLSKRLAALKKGAPVMFGGKFHVPIADGIAETAERICLISTGVGLGPVLGYLEQAAERGEERPTSVYAGFRAFEDVILESEIEDLQSESDLHFQLCVSELQDERYPPPPGYEGLRGRVTAAVPKVLEGAQVQTTHFHLIGNGGMVKAFKAALALAGVPDDHVTIETYFNHKAEVSDAEVAAMAKALKEEAQVSAWAGAES